MIFLHDDGFLRTPVRYYERARTTSMSACNGKPNFVIFLIAQRLIAVIVRRGFRASFA